MTTEEVAFCDCTNEELELDKTCGRPECPNSVTEMVREHRGDYLGAVEDLESGARRLKRQIELLNEYGTAKFGDDWWPGNAVPWIGREKAMELHELGVDQGLPDAEQWQREANPNEGHTEGWYPSPHMTGACGITEAHSAEDHR
jgi:hypothetical protein